MNQLLRVAALLACSTLLQFSSIAGASGEVPKETASQVVDRLLAYYHSFDSLRFNFFQRTSGQMTGRARQGKGNAILVRTNAGPLMRWNYTSPDRQVIISDGSQVEMYFEKLNQLIIAPVDQAQADIIFSFFSGQQRFSESFSILDADPTPTDEAAAADGLRVVTLLPRSPDSQLNTVQVWVDAASQIRRLELLDHFETRTTLTFSDLAVDTVSPADSQKVAEIFSFTPPEGTEIIRQ